MHLGCFWPLAIKASWAQAFEGTCGADGHAGIRWARKEDPRVSGGPQSCRAQFPPVCVCCLEMTLCIECSLFSHFFFQGQFKLSKYKNHLVRVHKLAIILSCVCVFVRSGWEASGWPLRLLTEGTSPSRVLPFCTHSWRTDSARHPPASLTL